MATQTTVRSNRRLPARPTSSLRGSGTSQATAIVSGSVALLLSKTPSLTPNKVLALLRATSRELANAPKAATSGKGAIDLTAAYNLASIPGTKTYNAAVGNGTLVQARGTDPLPCTTPDSVQANVGTVALTGTASGGLCSSVYNLPNALSTDTERDIFGNYVNRYTRQTVEKSWHTWVSVPANCGVVTTTWRRVVARKPGRQRHAAADQGQRPVPLR